jgi:hypothetical protein
MSMHFAEYHRWNERGDLAGKLPFPDLKKQALIDKKANAADQDPEFSQRIRESLAGFQE